MLRRVLRVLPALVVALVVGALGSGSFAVAHGDHHRSRAEKSSGSPQRCDKSCSEHRYSAWDEQWLMMSIEGDLFEIQGGKLAEHKGSTEKVRELGATLVKDHTQSLMDATALAKKLGIPVPSEPSPTQQWELQVVAQFSGTKFDRWYSDLEVKDHMQDIQEAQDEADKGCNPEIRDDAEDEIPMLERHLKLAQDALASVS
jgi:putative membrane protein